MPCFHPAHDCAINKHAHHRVSHRGLPRPAPAGCATEPAAQPACDGAEMHIKEGDTVRPMESFAAHETAVAKKLPTLAPPDGIALS